MALDPPFPGIVQSRQQAMRDANRAAWRSTRAHRVILVPVAGDQADTAALDMAGIVSGRLHARVVCLHVRAPAGMVLSRTPGGASTSELLEHVERAARQRAALAHDTFRKWQQAGERGWKGNGAAAPQWFDIEAPVLETVAQQARTSDLIVVGRSPHDHAMPSDAVLDGALLCSGRPVLLVPGPVRADPFGTVMIAWNDSVEAAHAVGAAWPLIVRSRRVIVFVGTHEGDFLGSAERFVARLDWRGPEPVKVICDPSDGVGDALLKAANQENAGLLITGAYSYDRLQRLVLGSVTRHILANGTTPVLMAC
jgi:nucleotide-binding universal stress UspA family protein